MRDSFSNGYIIRALALILIIGGLLFFIFPDPWPYVKGLAFGGLISMAMFKHLYITIVRSVEMEVGKAQVYAGLQYFLRYIIYGVTIFIAAKADYLNLWTCLIGLFSVKYAIWLTNLYDIHRGKRKEEDLEERNHFTS